MPVPYQLALVAVLGFALGAVVGVWYGTLACLNDRQGPAGVTGPDPHDTTEMVSAGGVKGGR